jgi:hypothetical protein
MDRVLWAFWVGVGQGGAVGVFVHQRADERLRPNAGY